MFVTIETLEQTRRRLQRVARVTSVTIFEGEWYFDEGVGPDGRAWLRDDALAAIRDGKRWSQLVPVPSGGCPAERCRIWSCHFPDQLDNSGFVGWLASELKARTGSGVFVVCGHNSQRGGIFDYWGCPAAVADAVLGELRALTRTTMNQLHMRPTARSPHGQIDPETLFVFRESSDGSVTGTYSGGSVAIGSLIGVRTARGIAFDYMQRATNGEMHAGRSDCELTVLADGRAQLNEHFRWDTRTGEGTNVLIETDD